MYGAARRSETVTTPGVTPIHMDITDPSSAAVAAELANDVMILINNAGMASSATLLGSSIAGVRAPMESHYYGTLSVTRGFAAHLIANAPGAVLNVVSVLSWLHPNYHFTYEKQGADAVREMPGGAAWLEETERTPKLHRHLEIHRNHALDMSNADNAAWNAGGSPSLTATTLSGTPELVAAKVRDFAEQGATELVYHVSGTDVHRELATFAEAVRI
ncbi:MAG: hypothetical protein QOE94_544 [Mycobacterium sp.]|nr:hypothetical protein [Mycobacterium sp.]MDT7719533.1 hypothetical protein [Mycobacterium sp.]